MEEEKEDTRSEPSKIDLYVYIYIYLLWCQVVSKEIPETLQRRAQGQALSVRCGIRVLFECFLCLSFQSLLTT